MKVAALFLALALGGAAISCHAQPPYGKVRPATKTLGVPGGGCSGTAVGWFTILTANHCVADGAMAVTVDGKQCEVIRIVEDRRDHALLLLGHECPQKDFVRMRPRIPLAGETIFLWGNPGKFEDLLRIGVVSGRIETPKDVSDEMGTPESETVLFTGAFARGDSGSGVFDRRGRLIGVLSWNSMLYTFPPYLFTGMIPLNFTKEQLQAVGL